MVLKGAPLSTYLKVVRVFLHVLVNLLRKESDRITNEEVSHVLSQQVVQTWERGRR